MGKLCPRGKAAAKRKFKVYPSAYANMYASAVCSGGVLSVMGSSDLDGHTFHPSAVNGYPS